VFNYFCGMRITIKNQYVTQNPYPDTANVSNALSQSMADPFNVQYSNVNTSALRDDIPFEDEGGYN